MKLRITGTEEECAVAVEILRIALTTREVSGFYPNRGDTVLGRVYLDVEVSPNRLRAHAERVARTELEGGRGED